MNDAPQVDPLDQIVETSCAVPLCGRLVGCAGTGKTYTVMHRVAADPSYGMLTSTTGISAVNLGAITLNSALKYFDYVSLRDSYLRGSLTRILIELARKHRRLIIEEYSMLEDRQLDILYRAAEEVVRRDETREFGLLLVGDLCFARGTNIMMADGTLRYVENIQIGDQVMGPDSKPRNVLRIASGVDDMYRVDQTNGDSYTVNSRHLLALKRSQDGKRVESWGKRYPATTDFLAMDVREFSAKSQKFKECFVGYKAGVIQFPPVDVYINPYFLGMWLGDGDSDGPRITTMDDEVIVFVKNYAQELNMTASTSSWERTPAVRVRITKGRAAGNDNPLWKKFRTYDLPKNKHIPNDYLYNSEKVRLDVLAGLIDSDGTWGGNRFTLVNLNEGLIRQSKQLADQLGFRTGLRSFDSDGKTAWLLSIGGDTWRIPTKVARKQSYPRDLVRSRLTSVLEISSVGLGDYFGFETDGDHLFLLADGTVAHNCQLPPVSGRWCFRAECWPKFMDGTERLTKVWRQDGGAFLDALNLTRAGDGGAAADILSRAGVTWHTACHTEFEGTTILPKNDMVSRYNALALSRLPGRAFTVSSRRWGQQRAEWGENRRTHEWGVPLALELKVGAYVMVLSNSVDFSVVNGDCGYVLDYQNGAFIVKLVRTGREEAIRPIVRDVSYTDEPRIDEGAWITIPGDEDHGSYHPYRHRRMRARKWVTGQVEYTPLRLAYASTVHKSQSLTLDRVQADFRDPFFKSPAMLYVALSRCRTLDGLRLVGQPDQFVRACNTDRQILPWL